MYHPHPTPDYSAATPTPGHYPQYQSPVLPGAGADFTDQWVSQAAAAEHDNDWDQDDMRPDSGMSGGRDSDDEDDEGGEYLDQETVEQFEDRVLNKRAGKVRHQSYYLITTTQTKPLIQEQPPSYLPS